MGVTRPVNQHRSRLARTFAGGLAGATLLALTSGCTSGKDDDQAGPSELPSRSVRSQATLEAKPVPTDVAVASVVGRRLEREQRQRLEKQVAKVVSQYFDDAFLGGEYPREDFSRAFATFSRGAADRAARDRDLLTNVEIGTSTGTVVPRTKQARLDVLVPKHLAGLTARIRLVFDAESAEETEGAADRRVTVKGRLLMNRTKSGTWQIFGYDLTRSSVPVSKGAS